MKSNQLNIIASLLLITAGISAENVSYLQAAKDKAGEYLTTVKNNMPEASLKNAGISALVVAVPTAAYAGYKRFFENKAIVAAANGQDIEKIEGYDKDVFTTVTSNLDLKSIKPDAQVNLIANIDDACWNTGYKLQWALRKMYYNPIKTAATILGLLGTGYMVHHFELDTKALDKVNSGASVAYNALPAKPSWFGIPTVVSNFFGKKAEAKQPEQANTPAADQTPAATPAPAETPAATPAPVETPAATPAPVEAPATVIEAGV